MKFLEGGGGATPPKPLVPPGQHKTILITVFRNFVLCKLEFLLKDYNVCRKWKCFETWELVMFWFSLPHFHAISKKMCTNCRENGIRQLFTRKENRTSNQKPCTILFHKGKKSHVQLNYIKFMFPVKKDFYFIILQSINLYTHVIILNVISQIQIVQLKTTFVSNQWNHQSIFRSVACHRFPS